MKVVIPGGAGQVGTLLARAFHRDGHDVVVLSRQSIRRPWRVVSWNGLTLDDGWVSEIDGSDVVVNLAGRSVNCRYTPANRSEILESRVHSTRVVGRAIAEAVRPPRVWLQASTATIYAHRFDASNDEFTGAIGGAIGGPTGGAIGGAIAGAIGGAIDGAIGGTGGGAEPDAPEAWGFSVAVARAWESACAEVVVPRTRKVLLRSAMTMSPDPGGIFDTLFGLVRRGLGGRAGDGRQFVSWIHEVDFVRVIQRLIEDDGIEGAVNIASPNPLPNAEFMRVLRDAGRIRLGLPATRWMLEVGAVIMQTETELVLKSRRVVPVRLLEHGFVFTYPRWADAACDLCNRWRQLAAARRAS